MSALSGERLISATGVAGGAHGAKSPRVVRFERLAFALLASLAAAYFVAIIVKLPIRANKWDFNHYYASALVMREGGDPYKTDLQPIGARLGLKIDQINRATYPPTFIWCFSPLTRLPLREAFFVWQAISLACLAAGLVLLMRGTVSGRAAKWLTLAVVLFAPVELHMAYSQSQFMVFLMLVLAILALEHSRDGEAGLILAAAALLRAYPLAMGGYLVVRQQWRALAWMVAGLVAGGAITVAAVGLHTCLDFRYAIALVTTRLFIQSQSNIALGSFISRFFWRLSDYGLIASHESVRRAVSFGVCGALAIAVAMLTWTRNGGEHDVDRRAYSLWVATMILISPTAWDHYLVLLLLPFIQITSAAVAGRVGRPAVLMCMASYLLAEIFFWIFPANGFVRPNSLLTAELGFISAATAWVGTVMFAGTPPNMTVTHPSGLTATASQSATVA